jgi:hypothetical protein
MPMRSRALVAGGTAALVLLACAGHAISTAPAAELKTLKERLSDKASDNQRVNNCGVPLDRQGPVPRPGCPGETAAPAPAAKQADTKTPKQR